VEKSTVDRSKWSLSVVVGRTPVGEVEIDLILVTEGTQPFKAYTWTGRPFIDTGQIQDIMAMVTRTLNDRLTIQLQTGIQSL
jgi:hypothetical protein